MQLYPVAHVEPDDTYNFWVPTEPDEFLGTPPRSVGPLRPVSGQ